MAILTFNNIHKSFGSQVVFDQLDLKIFKGEKVGLIGPNGCGKTTLFKLITGDEKVDIGQIVSARNMKIGYLPQEPAFDGEKTIIEEMHSGIEEVLILQRKLENLSHQIAEHNDDNLQTLLKEYDQINHKFELVGGYDYEYQLKIILEGVGLSANLWDAKIKTLSGGQLSRLGLAKVLINKSDLLLLDEPTNHLDLNGRQWLEKFIAKFEGAVIIISHDRYLLDMVCQKIIEVQNKKIKVWTGNYTQFVENREKTSLAQQRENQKRVEFVKDTLDFIARNLNKEGMRGTARGRKTRLEKLLKHNPDYLDSQRQVKKVQFGFNDLKKQSQIALRCKGLSKSFDNLTLFDNLDLELYAGQRLGVIGPNGTGKSTLLKVLLGKIQPTGGNVYILNQNKIGYLDQQAAELDYSATVLDEALKSSPSDNKERLRSILGSFLFTGDDVFKQVGDLSGGQQNRLALCKLVIANPELLILDEPTNHLDIDTREMLENALEQYQGALLVVSHDRYFLDRIVDQILVIGADELGDKKFNSFEFINGSYTEYINLLEKRKEQAENANLGKAKSTIKSARKNKPTKTAPDDIKQFNKYSVEQIESMIMDMENQISDMQQQFGDEQYYKDAQKYSRLQADYEQKKSQLQLLYKAYEYKIG